MESVEAPSTLGEERAPFQSFAATSLFKGVSCKERTMCLEFREAMVTSESGLMSEFFACKSLERTSEVVAVRIFLAEGLGDNWACVSWVILVEFISTL